MAVIRPGTPADVPRVLDIWRAAVDASEQAANALPFYEARGFVRTGRSETDPDGRPYPLVHLRYRGAGSASKLGA
jgi:putative acetyltransferase